MTIRFVHPDHADILRDYLDNKGVVLVFPEAQDAATAAGLEDGGDAPAHYDFGGDADVWVDKVTSPDHYVFSSNDDSE